MIKLSQPQQYIVDMLAQGWTLEQSARTGCRLTRKTKTSIKVGIRTVESLARLRLLNIRTIKHYTLSDSCLEMILT